MHEKNNTSRTSKIINYNYIVKSNRSNQLISFKTYNILQIFVSIKCQKILTDNMQVEIIHVGFISFFFWVSYLYSKHIYNNLILYISRPFLPPLRSCISVLLSTCFFFAYVQLYTI